MKIRIEYPTAKPLMKCRTVFNRFGIDGNYYLNKITWIPIWLPAIANLLFIERKNEYLNTQ